MATPVFDPKRKYAPVVGHSAARYYQDGHHFTADGRYLSWEDAAKDPRVSPVDAVESTEKQSLAARERRASKEAPAPETVSETVVGKPKEGQTESDDPAEAIANFQPTTEISKEPPTEKVLDETDDPRWEQTIAEPPKRLSKVVETIKGKVDYGALSRDERADFDAHPAKGTGSKEKNARFIIRWTAP